MQVTWVVERYIFENEDNYQSELDLIEEVKREARFVVAVADIDNSASIIASSQYYENGEYVKPEDFNIEFESSAYHYLTEILENKFLSDKGNSWHPDKLYTVDICEVNNELHVLELNSFSCSNLYGCNLSNIVAIAEWKEAYE